MRLGIVFAILVLVAPQRVGAETAARTEGARPITIAVLGDSLAEGLWGSLYRRFARNPDIRIVNATRAATGFNDDAYDAILERLFARPHIDLLIVQTGANDRQRAVSLDGRDIAPFGTSRWFLFYSQRLTYFLARLQRRGVPVLWVGLPVMRDAPYDAGMRIISRMQQEHTERHGAQFLDIAAFTADSEGAFVEMLAVAGGHERRFRHEDGVHFWEFGYDRVAGYVLTGIRTRYPGLLPEGQARAELPFHKP